VRESSLEALGNEFPNAIPEALRRATLWTVALDQAVRGRGGVAKEVRGLERVTYGFVEGRSGIHLAAILYVRFWALAQAAPLFIKVQGNEFPLVIRPMFRDRSRSGGLMFSNGVPTSRVRLGSGAGILTAAHVVAKDGDRSSLREGDLVSCTASDSAAPGQRRVVRVDSIMDAAVIDDGTADPSDRVVQANPFVGYFPIEIRSPDGEVVSGAIVETEVAQGVVPGAPGQRPSEPAVVLTTITGEPGWSGSMVWDAS
jgi:hypothetical protein